MDSEGNVGLFRPVKEWEKRFTVITGGRQFDVEGATEWCQFTGYQTAKVEDALQQAVRNATALLTAKGAVGVHEVWSQAEVGQQFVAHTASEAAWVEWAHIIREGIAIQEGEAEQGNEVMRVIREDDIEDVIYVGGRVTQTIQTPHYRKGGLDQQETGSSEQMEVDFETHITADGTRKRKRDGELAGDQLVRETLELKDSSKVEEAEEVEKTEEVEVEEPEELEGADAIQVLQLLHDLKILKEAWESVREQEQYEAHQVLAMLQPD
ncbi:hypothetical protein BDZ91DRAFT_845259 [Kalaharituber pfeilii]|nr:hypothetical protein BDZ91DRAFT_845259 [Kalaharituber pfeilii]